MRRAASDLQVLAVPDRHVSPAVISAGVLRIAHDIEEWANKTGMDRVRIRDICVALQNGAASGRGLSREACATLARDIDAVIWSGDETARGADVIPLHGFCPPTLADTLAALRGEKTSDQKRDPHGFFGRGPDGAA